MSEREPANLHSARVFDAVQQAREDIFMAQRTHENVKTVLATLLSELTETAKPSKGTP
jgi:hypothetical protein